MHENIFFYKPLPELQVFSLMTNHQLKIEKTWSIDFFAFNFFSCLLALRKTVIELEIPLGNLPVSNI